MIEEIEVEDLEARLAAGAVLIDVRMPDEFEERRVPGARLIPLPELPDRVDEIDATVEVLIICRSGARSMRACEFLATQGVTAINIAGGTNAWADSGRTTETGPAGG